MSPRVIETYQVEDGWIETNSGRQFHFKGTIDPKEIYVGDVAHALSLLCRYNGHTKRFYSVAEHSVLIARHLKTLGYDDRTALTGLFHETAETYIGDMARPIKVTMTPFTELENRIEIAAAQRFGTIFPFPSIIKELDTRILVDERAQVMNPSNNEWGTDGIARLGVVVEGWAPYRAKVEFLKAVREFAPADHDFFE